MNTQMKGVQSPVRQELKFLHVANHRHEGLFNVPIMIGG